MGAHWDAAGCGRVSLDHAAVPQGRPRWTLDPWARRLRGCLQVTPGWLGLGSLGKGPGWAVQHYGQIGGSALWTEPGGARSTPRTAARPRSPLPSSSAPQTAPGAFSAPRTAPGPFQHHGQLRGFQHRGQLPAPLLPQISPSRSRSLHHPPRTSPAALPASPGALLLPCWNPRLMQNCYW